MSVYNMTLSTTEPTNNVGVISVRQGDKESQTFVAEIIENNISKDDINGYSVFLNVMFEDNIIARDLAAFDYGTGVATYTLNASFYQRIGKVSAYFSFEKDGVSDSTANFEYTVIPGACQNIRQGNYIYEFEQIKDILEQIINNGDFTSIISDISALRRITTSNSNVLSNHVADKENPHDLTPEKLGVYGKSEIDIMTNVSGKVVYKGATYFKASNTIEWDSQIMKMGIIIIFSRWERDGETSVGPGDYHFKHEFIAKAGIEAHAGMNHRIGMSDPAAMKVVYPYLGRLTGHDSNSASPNNQWCIREVIVI
ncbi:BppU family phage baseplate upper protein [Vagococcus salmoninarum]|uniref:BppU N-terminal domain-containing protein n=1 Tax=Vagococcus salmoninarum TaxID=2739 RepID=A0A429ZSE8_9ENTE|nr:BppU family phage baseplate upper protein [Vagococcus salmoninarum]RST96664.1 hypothetical protein CBF35_05375 [Vagococcus salmoninarum]